ACLLEVRIVIQTIVAEELEGVSARFFGPRTRDDIDDTSGSFSELGRIGIRQHLEFLNGLLAEGGTNGADHRIVVVDTIHHDVVRACALASEGQSGSGRGSLLRGAVGGHSWRDDAEAEEIASIRG